MLVLHWLKILFVLVELASNDLKFFRAHMNLTFGIIYTVGMFCSYSSSRSLFPGLLCVAL